MRSIVVAALDDPHGTHLADALPKLQGLARYAETHSSDYRRVETVAEISGTMRVLDLTRQEVRDGIASVTSAASLYSGVLARDYV